MLVALTIDAELALFSLDANVLSYFPLINFRAIHSIVRLNSPQRYSGLINVRRVWGARTTAGIFLIFARLNLQG